MSTPPTHNQKHPPPPPPNRSCVGHVYALGKIIQGRKGAGIMTYCFFLDVQKAYETVWGNVGKISGKLGSEEICGK